MLLRRNKNKINSSGENLKLARWTFRATMIFGFIGIIGIVWGGYYAYAQYKLQHGSLKPAQPPLNIDRTPISLWVASKQQYNDLINEDGILSLSAESYRRQRNEYRQGIPVHDPQGYIRPS